MPEQPDDPIHYEMKIPPEPKNDKQEKDEDSSLERGDDRDTEIARDDDKVERRPGS